MSLNESTLKTEKNKLWRKQYIDQCAGINTHQMVLCCEMHKYNYEIERKIAKNWETRNEERDSIRSNIFVL